MTPKTFKEIIDEAIDKIPTKVYFDLLEARARELNEFEQKLLANQKELDPEKAKIVNDNLIDMV